MGVLPLQFMDGESRKTLSLSGDEQFDIIGLDQPLTAKQTVAAVVHYANGEQRKLQLQLRLDTAVEVDYYRSGGVLNYVLKRMIAEAGGA